ncbi:DoxX domain protein (plasmid) [Natronomonas pharaonis DSM 2160]|uniref:DoxX domain protein n=1 Tax=Natronomonas pharaonis (strain ATCC 35678 / DSM 2160 / CIP 103997 / JCM 8858 / NBRC 14720 / NCIMB 2260 / Gabara) TaxID=348780 RepID=Q3IM45_NATPD|nr:DoxX family protein [Natronomonas pharaonis]CAI50818.1 DoxX domain protein [Natronomonas pharaonis DSM 2160]
MATQNKRTTTKLFGRGVSYGTSGQWNSYWLLFLRLVMGWWFFSSGLSKIVEYGVLYDAHGWMMFGTEGTIVYPITAWFAANAVWLPNLLIPWGQLLIGLGLIVGCLTRLAAANGAVLMFFFYFGNAEWGNGFVNGDLFGLLLFLTIIVFAAGRVWGIDAYLEGTNYVKNRPKLRYILG